MNTNFRQYSRILAAVLAAVLSTAGVAGAQQRASVRGQVTDELGAAIRAARVALTDAGGKEVAVETDRSGSFALGSVAPGTYVLTVAAEGFSEYAEADYVVAAGAPPLAIKLTVAAVAESVTVGTDELEAEPSSNKDALVIKGKDLEALPDDPDELAAALQEMAGPAAGPGGGQIYIDGFTGGRLPPKEAIREIRINSNPFSAEYDRIGFGRIEVLTKPGSDRFRGTVVASFTDESLNARNPFAPSRAPEQDRRFSGNVSGPLGKRASFFFDVERREEDESETVTATVLDASLEPVPFSESVLETDRRTTFSPRLDVQLNQNNTLVLRYGFTDDSETNTNTGGYTLPSGAVNSGYREHVLTATETAVLGQSVISETRLQLARRRSTTQAVESGVVLNVSDAFRSGSSAGFQERSEDRLELQQNFSFVLRSHALRTGVRVRAVKLGELSTANYEGTFTFGGDVERDPVTGQPLPGSTLISSLEQYRRTLLGLPGYQPSQFSIAGGDPFSSATKWDVGAFVQDDWRIRPELTLSLGLRYESQSNVDDALNFAPRLGIAYSLNGPDGRPTTVFRGGFGVFFDRVDEGLTLDEARFDGVHQLQFVIPRPAFFPNVPSVEQLEEFAVPGTIRLLEATENPYTIQGSLGVERSLGWGMTASAYYVWSRGLHQLRTRNLNAPDPVTGARPLGLDAGNVYAYETSGRTERQQLRFGLQKRGGPVTVFSNYTVGWSEGDTDGPGSAPSNPFDIALDYGRAGDDVRHFVVFGGTYTAPFGIQLSPFVNIRSGRPYNITIGGDLNRDSFFNDRPSFAAAGEEGAVASPIGLLDPTPDPGDVIIPRNVVEGSGSVRVNLAASKTVNFGGSREGRFDPSATTQVERGGMGGGPGGGRGGGRGGPGGGRGGGGMGEAQSGNQRFGLTFTVRASNLFNTPTYFNPSGVLTSPTFGLPNAAAPGRRIETQVRFNF